MTTSNDPAPRPCCWLVSGRLRIFGQGPTSALLVLSIALATNTVHAQQPRATSDWHRVQALAKGATVEVKAIHQHVHCKISAVTEDALACTQTTGDAATVLQREEIRTVRVSHRGRSALIGAGIGGGGLAIAGFAATTNSGGFFGPNFLRGPATGVGAVAGGLLGGGIGALTDFAHTTIYRAP